jgi:hypothetical protein
VFLVFHPSMRSSYLNAKLRTLQFVCGVTLCFSIGAARCQAGEGFVPASEERGLQRAAAVVGKSESTSLALVRELQMWRRRALEAEDRLSGAVQTTSAPPKQEGSRAVNAGFTALEPANSGKFEVVSAMPDERVLILSAGRESGIFEGALLRLDSGVVAKVLESRPNCCAAVLENSFRGKVSALEGQSGRVLLRQPVQ